jgi:translocation and assembly module TamA
LFQAVAGRFGKRLKLQESFASFLQKRRPSFLPFPPLAPQRIAPVIEPMNRPPSAPWHRLAYAALCLLLPAPAAWAADPLPYTVSLAKTGQGPLDAALAGSLQLESLRTKAPAGPFAVLARARADLPRLQTALESFGYYQAQIGITVAGRTLDDPSLPDMLLARPAQPPVAIAIAILPGPLFHLRHVALAGDVPAPGRAAFTLQPGQPAQAALVLGAAGAVLVALREDGYAFANVASPDAVLVPQAHALDVTLAVTAGPRVDLGPFRITGLKRVNESYVRRRLLIHPGQLYQPSKLEAARQDLAATGVFSGVVVRTAPKLDAQGTLPVTIDVAERDRHAVSFNVGYSTDLGGSAGATWTHRNVFGNAEQLNLAASISGLGGSAVTAPGYTVTAQLLKPDFWRRDQTLQFDLGALKQSLDAYDQEAVTAGTTLTRKWSKQWTVSAGVSAEEEQITQEDVVRDYTLVALPVSAKFDNTGLTNPLDDALHGIRAALSAAPTESLGDQQQYLLRVAGFREHLYRSGGSRRDAAGRERGCAARAGRQRAGRHQFRSATGSALLCRRIVHGARVQISVGGPIIRRP